MINIIDDLRPWVPEEAESFIQQHAERYQLMSFDELELKAFSLIEAHEKLMDQQSIVLYAGTNVINPKAAKMLSSSIGSRASLGYPGAKYNKGMEHADQLEIMLMSLMRQLFQAKYVEYRVPSGSIANLYAYMATTKPGDKIMSFSDAAAGHVTHHAEGAAGLYGLEIHEVPFDFAQMDVDQEALMITAKKVRPKLIIIAGSMCLFPYSLQEVRKIADEVGAWILYDAAHMGGLIAGGEFQRPLKEGADLMTGSTYKSFGGPPSGMVFTNSAELAARLDKIAFPGLTANFDLSRVAAMVIAVLDLLTHGREYAKMCIANAKALAETLHTGGCEVFHVSGKGFTNSQHVALPAATYGGGDTASKLLEKSNLFTSGIGLPLPPVPGDFNAMRLGTQEITRWGMRPENMETIANFFCRLLLKQEKPKKLKSEVIEFRKAFQKLHYIRD
ncbi:MAG: aminotransferase class I/II-fold pyridoxal phosphate-dependent enzyme [Candidatus Lambdaproteobacteria bacterium]